MAARPRSLVPRRTTAVSLAIALAAAGVLVPVPAVAEESASAKPPGCGTGSWVAGTVDLCSGELVYRDYVYDDHGAASNTVIPPEGEGLYAAIRPYHDGWGNTSPAGAADYGPDLESRNNTADLVALRLRVTRDTLSVTAELNTVYEGSDARVVVGIDNIPVAQRGATWPGVIANPFLGTPLTNNGLDTFITLKDGDPASNLLTARVPRPSGTSWRVQAVVARPMPTSAAPVVMNVAFRGPDERGGWWENAQAAALAHGDISAFGHTVNLRELDRRLTRRADVPSGKLRQRVYVSQHNPGTAEGIDHNGVPGPGTTAEDTLLPVSQGFTHIGKYQPYGFYLPPKPGPHELQLLLHGMGENHSAQMWDPAGGANPPPIAAAFGADSNRIFASPLGRGPRGWYSSYSERDVLDVLADVKANYPVTADKVFMSGTSMGGYGAMRIGALHPEEFAAVVQWVGYTGDSLNGSGGDGTGVTNLAAVGNAVDLLGNLRHVPIATWYAGADELVHVNHALAVRDRLAALRVPSAWWLHPVANHSSPATINDWAKESAWSAGRSRERAPSRVTFRTDSRFFAPEAGILPNRAYWVSRIRPAGPGYTDVDVASAGCGIGAAETALTTGEGTDPIPWTGQFIDVIGRTERPKAQRLELTVSNVTALTIDADASGACLDGRSLEYRVSTDRPVTITLSDGRSIRITSAGTHGGTLRPA